MAGDGTISGTVTDAEDNPLASTTVDVLIDGTTFVHASTTTDANGDYSVTAAGDSTYDVRFRHYLHEPSTTTGVAVVTGNTTTVDVSLAPRTYKTRGKLSDDDGIGVLGHNTASSGESRGVVGITDAVVNEAVGVQGLATDAVLNWRTIGVDGRSLSNSGIGVRGESDTGVKGITENNYGVHGKANASQGSAYGVVGETNSKDGRGVSGTAYDGTAGSWSSSTVMGVFGATNRSGADSGLAVGYGVRGESKASNGQAYGVSGYHSGSDGAGTHGEVDTRDGVAGVLGQANNIFASPSSRCYGVRGETDATGTDAAGVRGEATSGSGTVHGVYGTTNSEAAGAASVYSDGKLRVAYRSSTSSQSPTDHAALIEDTQDRYSSVLALRLGDSSADDASEFDNYVTFYESDDTAVGSIESTGSSGVNLNTSSADYAEYLPRADPAESIDAAEVVGVHGGEVSQTTADADRVLVVSDQPAVTGNSPGEDTTGHEIVAFTGQIPVKIRGTVETGDVIVPSGEGDGTAVAVAPPAWNPDTPIVGQAWESSDEPGLSEVTVAVGIGDEDVLASAVEELQAENAALRERVDDLESRLCDLEAATTSPASADD